MQQLLVGNVSRWNAPTHNTGDLGLNPSQITMKAPSLRKATGNSPVASTSQEVFSEPSRLWLCYAGNLVCCATSSLDEERKGTRSPAPGFFQT